MCGVCLYVCVWFQSDYAREVAELQQANASLDQQLLVLQQSAGTLRGEGCPAPTQHSTVDRNGTSLSLCVCVMSMCVPEGELRDTVECGLRSAVGGELTRQGATVAMGGMGRVEGHGGADDQIVLTNGVG